MEREKELESTEEPTEILENEPPASAPDAELMATGVTAEDVDWNLVEKEKESGHRIIFTAKSAATGKTYEYTAEAVKAIEHWNEVGKKARADLDAFKAKGVRNLKDGHCPRCKRKIDYERNSCPGCCWFCEYCFALHDGPMPTCECYKIEGQYHQTMRLAGEEGMKYRKREYQDWLGGIKAERNEKDERARKEEGKDTISH